MRPRANNYGKVKRKETQTSHKLSEGRVTGYTNGIGFLGYALGENNEDLKALVGAAKEFAGPDSYSRLATVNCSAGVCNTDCAS